MSHDPHTTVIGGVTYDVTYREPFMCQQLDHDWQALAPYIENDKRIEYDKCRWCRMIRRMEEVKP